MFHFSPAGVGLIDSVTGSRRAVRLNDFERRWASIRDEVIAAVDLVGGRGQYVLGREVLAFEGALANYWGIPLAIGVASGLDAIEIALRALGLRPGELVLTTPLSAFATTLAIIRAGGRPVFADVDDSGLSDLDACDRALAARPDIRWFVPVHLFGHCLDLGHLELLKERHGVRIVEDCAQAIGARWNGRPVGTVGDAAATSFYPTKNLGALGDGGALLVDRKEVADRCRILRDYGREEPCLHTVLGLNSRIDEIHAALLGRVLLPRLPEWTERRRAIAALYCEGVRNPLIRLPAMLKESSSTWHLFPILVPMQHRSAFVAALASRGVETGLHYPLLIPQQPAMRTVTFDVMDELTKARHFAACEISLPIHPFLTDEEVATVVSACNAWRP